jgi:CsoR family transcriptional regulator, copper-sensing transcriptional repressor
MVWRIIAMYRKDDLLVRLRKIEGQVRGVAGMIEEDRSCSDIVNQLMAAERGLDMVGYMIVQRCLKDLLYKHGKAPDKPIEEIDSLIKLLMKYAKYGAEV